MAGSAIDCCGGSVKHLCNVCVEFKQNHQQTIYNIYHFTHQITQMLLLLAIVFPLFFMPILYVLWANRFIVTFFSPIPHHCENDDVEKLLSTSISLLLLVCNYQNGLEKNHCVLVLLADCCSECDTCSLLSCFRKFSLFLQSQKIETN